MSIDPNAAVAKLQAVFAAAEEFAKASAAADEVADEDDCRVLVALEANHADILAVFYTLIRSRIVANASEPSNAADEALAAANRVVEELREQANEVSSVNYRLQILLRYLEGEVLGPEDLELAGLTGPDARSLPQHLANFDYWLQCAARHLGELGKSPELADLETRLL